MDVRGEGAAEAEAVGAGLLLCDRPGGAVGALVQVGGLVVVEEADQLRPLRAGFDVDQARFSVEVEDAVEAGGINEGGAGGELLPAHRVTAAGDAEEGAGVVGGADGSGERRERGGSEDGGDAGGVELRVDVVDKRVGSVLLMSKCHVASRLNLGGSKHGGCRRE